MVSANASSHRLSYVRSAILTGALTMVLITLALWDWNRLGYSDEWPVAQAVITRSIPYYLRDHPRRPSDYPNEYGLTYRYTVNDQTYHGRTRLSVPPMRWEEAAEQYRVGRSIPVWYHPALPGLSFASRITLVYDIVLLSAGAFLGWITLMTLLRILQMNQR